VTFAADTRFVARHGSILALSSVQKARFEKSAHDAIILVRFGRIDESFTDLSKDTPNDSCRPGR